MSQAASLQPPPPEITTILFLIDSSASMAQRNYMGCSAIDTAKSIVQDILMLRQRDANNRQTDRYMLFSTEEFPGCVKAGWKEGSGVFHEQLKALRPCGKHPLNTAILSALHFVNLSRAQTGVDYYGHGRFPYLQESVVVITISDASGVSDMPSDFELRTDPKNAAPGTEYTEEAFRWDQRVFSIVLRMSARCPPEPRIALAAPVAPEQGVIQRVCAATGGRSFSIVSHKQQSNAIEILTQMIHINGVVLRFEYPAPGLRPRNDASIAVNGELAEEERKAEEAGDELRKALEARPTTFLLTRNRAPGHWPIPEAFWPDAVQNSTKLPIRKAHPMLTIGLSPIEAQVNTEFPFDKYALDPACALSDFVRERTAAAGVNANVCWQVSIANSYQAPGPGKPFGYLKIATNGTTVNLFLLPYNYPILLRLLDEQKADPRLRAQPEWRKKLEAYITACPSYYKQQLKNALQKALRITGGILDEPARNLYAPQLNKALITMKSVGKDKMDKLVAEICARLSKPPGLPSYRVPVERRENLPPAQNFRIEWEEEVKRAKLVAAAKADEPERKKGRRSRLSMPAPRPNTVVFEDDIGPDPEAPEPTPPLYEPHPNLMIDMFACQDTTKGVYTNPYNIAKNQLAQMLPRLRINLEHQMRDSPIPALEGALPGALCTLQTAYELHSLPVAHMSNYNKYVKSLEAIGAGPLREVEHRAMRENIFGNPFKKSKKSLVAVDEMGEAPKDAPTEETSMSIKDRRAMESNRPPRRKAGPLALESMQIWRDRRRLNSMSTVSDLSHTAEDLTDDISEAEASGSISSTDVEEMVADMAAFPTSSTSTTSPNGGGAQSGAAKQAPVSPASSRDSGVVSEWGLEDEAEEAVAAAEGGGSDDNDVMVVVPIDDEAPPPPAKKAKLSDGRGPCGSDTAAAAAVPVSTPSARRAAAAAAKEAGEEATLERIRHLNGEVVRVTRQFLSDDAMLTKIETLLSPLGLRALIIMTKFALDEVKRFKKRALTAKLQQQLTELEAVASSIPLGGLLL